MSVRRVPPGGAINPILVISIKLVLEPDFLRRNQAQSSEAEFKLLGSGAQFCRCDLIDRDAISKDLLDDNRWRQLVYSYFFWGDRDYTPRGRKPEIAVHRFPACRLEPSIALPAFHSVGGSI